MWTSVKIPFTSQAPQNFGCRNDTVDRAGSSDQSPASVGHVPLSGGAESQPSPAVAGRILAPSKVADQLAFLQQAGLASR
jgi:hypothetical protein